MPFGFRLVCKIAMVGFNRDNGLGTVVIDFSLASFGLLMVPTLKGTPGRNQIEFPVRFMQLGGSPWPLFGFCSELELATCNHIELAGPCFGPPRNQPQEILHILSKSRPNRKSGLWLQLVSRLVPCILVMKKPSTQPDEPVQ